MESMQSIRPLLLLLASPLLLLLPACEPTPTAPVAAPAPEIISGRYEVRGVTHVIGATEKRRIDGIVILVQDGDQYTATFELKTKYPANGATSDADVIGIGRGVVKGGELDGNAETQIVVSSVPGVDTGFAFAPRTVSTRISSSSTAQIQQDGSIKIEIESRPQPGERYIPTRTRLSGKRVPGRTTADVATKSRS